MTKVRSLYLSFFSCILFFYTSTHIHAQQLIYEGFMRGEKVGELIANREVNDEMTKISLETRIEAHMLVKIVVEMNSESVYRDLALVEASSVAKANGHLKSSVITIKKDNGYQLDVNGDKSQLQSKSLIGADIFYFEEPANLKQIYALASGEMLEVVKGGENEYYFVHDGKKELHRYEDGLLQEVEINHALYSLTFKLKK
ncbi:MAG TPA: DUF6134 family protein [Roseivirga sp.]